MYKLFVHQWKEKQRAPFWQKNLIFNIILSLLGLYLAALVVVVSLFLDKILVEIYPGLDIIAACTGLLFYYFSFDLIARFLFQQLPTLSIQPYLTLPIRKSRLLHYIILKSLPSFFNVFAVLLFVPFFVKNVCSTQSFQFSAIWLISVLSIIGSNNFLNIYLKKHFSKKPVFILVILAAIGSLLYLDIAGLLSFSAYFSGMIYYLTQHTYLVVLPIGLVVLSYALAYKFLIKNAYIEDAQGKASNKTAGLNFLDQYGKMGHLLSLEVKLILRNKRPKSILFLSAFFLLYGLLLYTREDMDNYLILTFLGIVITSAFALNYGQFMFSWESSFFDGILIRDVNPYTYIRSKHLFLSITCVLGYLITLPYGFISYQIVFINLAFLLFNIGISIIVLLFFSTFSSSYIDLSKGQFMNYQGTGAAQFLMIIPIIGFPLLVYLLCSLLGAVDFYYYIVAIIGILGIAFNQYLIQLIVARFEKRKYKMALGFRQN